MKSCLQPYDINENYFPPHLHNKTFMARKHFFLLEGGESRLGTSPSRKYATVYGYDDKTQLLDDDDNDDS